MLYYFDNERFAFMLKKFEFTPVLGWSVSRYDVFKLCKRKYYYTYYAKYDPVHSRKKIESLKNMTSIPLEIGNIVHDMNKAILERFKKSEKPIDHKRFYDYVRKETDKYCNSKIFMEVYYKEINGINTEEILDKTMLSLNNFLNSKRFDWLIRKAFGYKDRWVIEPPGFGETRIDGMKAYCKVDFLFPVEEKMFIIDWKTGKADNDKHSRQLLGYSTWAAFHFRAEPENIIPIIAYLSPDYNEIQVSITESDIRAFSESVRIQTQEMYEFCINISENIPKDKELFSKTTNKIFCDYCNFRELCQ